ncbi:MAG: class I SAM-dependent methyltransferase [Ginsengibacter sp.]
MEQARSWYKEWFNSSYYHKLYIKRDNAEAAGFISHLIDYLKPAPGSLMLDIACGRGRHSIQLAQMDFDVTGIDLSENNILKAKESENDHLHFFNHDMRLPFWINYFNYAFNLFTSFGYFDTRREHDNAIRTIAQSLKPNGIVVIDYLNVHYEEKYLVTKTEMEINDVAYHITKWFDETHFHKKIIVKDKRLNDVLVFRERVAKFSLGDFTEMLTCQNVQIQEVFGDYYLADYNLNESPRMIIIARKVIS